MAAERQKLQEALCSYTSDTLAYFATVRDFYERRSRWMVGRETEMNIIKDIKERADKINLTLKHFVESENKGEAIAEYVKNKTSVKSKCGELEEELASVLKETLGGLEELSCFLDALEKLAVTSLPVFMENQVLHLPKGISLSHAQVVIIVARHVCPLLLEFKRDANAFFLPELQNVGVLSYQLDKYILTTQIILHKLEKSSFSEFDPNMNMKMVVELDVDLSEGDVHMVFSHIDQLDKIRNNQDFRMVFLFQEEEKCSDFISEFNERKSKMLQFLEELEDSCEHLDKMNKGAKISGIASNSVGAVGGVLSIVGLASAPFTAGASLALTIGGAVMGVVSGVNSIVTAATEIGVNCTYQHKAIEVFKSFIDDVQVLQDFLEEVSIRETSIVDVIEGAGKLIKKGKDILEEFNEGVDAFSALKTLKSKHVMASAGKVLAHHGQVSNVASDVPDVSQAALKGPLALSKSARAGFIVTNAFFVGMDIYFIYKDIKSLAKGSETEFSRFIRARAALWCLEIESWQKIHDCLSRGLLTSKENKAVLERLLHPEIKKEKPKETEMKTPSNDEPIQVDKKTKKRKNKCKCVIQ